jgi:hypothetical protein
MSIRNSILLTLLATATTQASPPTLESLLCIRDDTRFGQKNRHFVSIVAVGQPSSVAATDDPKDAPTATVRACKGKDCARFKMSKYAAQGLAINPTGTLLLASGHNEQASTRGLHIVSAKTGAIIRKIMNKDLVYSCGSGLWLGDSVLAFGEDCEEFDAMPYFANAKTGKYLAPLTEFGGDGESLYSAAQLDGKKWAIAAYNHNSSDLPDGRGKVFVVDVSSGKVFAMASGTESGGVVIAEGAQKRTLDKLPSCK